MIDIQALIDDAKCFQTFRAMRWPDGVRCPGCGGCSRAGARDFSLFPRVLARDPARVVRLGKRVA
jgi:hypothetical protein